MFNNNNDNANSSEKLLGFMNKQIDKASSESVKPTRINKTKQALEEARNKEKEGEINKLKQAKKDSAFKASRYSQSEMHKMRTKDFLAMLPFILLGVLFMLTLIFKGGPFLKSFISELFKNLLGR